MGGVIFFFRLGNKEGKKNKTLLVILYMYMLIIVRNF